MDASFHELKQQLEAAGYNAPLGIESTALVRQLYSDIAKIRSERDEALQQVEEINRSKDNLSDIANTLRRENSNLIESKNALHAEICRNGELLDDVERKAREAVSAAQAAANNYRFQLNTAMYQVKQQETDINRLKQKVMSLLDKSKLFAQSDPVNVINSSQTLELNDDRFEKFKFSNSKDSEHFAELIEIATQKVESLQDQVSHLNAVCDQLKNEKTALEKAISIRDAEFRRKESDLSHHNLDDRNCRQLSEQVDFLTKEMITLEAELKRYRAMEPLVEQLQKQRDDLIVSQEKCQKDLEMCQDELAREKKTVSTLIDEKQRDLHSSKSRIPRAVKDLEAAQTTIKRLQTQLSEVERQKKEVDQEHADVKKIYQSYSSDKALLSSLLEEAEKRAADAQEQLTTLQQQCDQFKLQNSKLNTQMQTLRQNVESYQKQIALLQQTVADQQASLTKEKATKESLSKEISTLEQTIETLSRDAEELSRKLAQANNDNKMLSDAIQDHANAAASVARKEAAEKSNAQRQTAITRSLQSERDQYRSQITDMNDLLTQVSSQKAAIERELNLEKQSRTDAEKQLTQALQEEEDLRDALAQRDVALLDLKRQVQDLSHEIADKQQEIATLKNICSSSGSNSDKLRETTSRCVELQRELNSIKHDLELQQNETEHLQKQLRGAVGHRDALMVVLREFDAHSISIQLQVQNLIRERDDLQFRNSQLLAELNVREQSQSSLDSHRLQEQQLLRQLKSDNSSLVAVVRQQESAIQNNEALLKSVRADLSDLQASRDNLLRDLQNERRLLSQSTTRNAELQSQLDLAKQDINRMNKQIGTLQHTIEQQRSTISKLRVETDQLQSLITQLENVKTNESTEVARLRSAVQTAHDDISQRDQQIAQYEMQLAECNNQLESLKHVTQNLDAERDRLCHLLDEKCEQLAQVQEHLKQDNEAVLSAQQAANQLHGRYDQLSLQHSTTLENLREQAAIIEQLQQHQQSLESQLHLKHSEIETLTEDLRNMTSENQFVNGELQLALQEKDTKGQEAFAAANKCLYLEELLRVQKLEKEELLTNYKILVSENKKLHDTGSELESKCQAQLFEIQRLTQRCLVAESKCQELNDGNSRLSLDIEQYQRTNERLTRSLATLQEQLNASNEEKSSLMGTLNTSRSLSVDLQTDRESLQRRLLMDQNSRNMLQDRIEELESKIESQVNQNQDLQKRIQEFESVLSAERGKLEKADSELHRFEQDNAKLKQFIVEYERKLSSKEQSNGADKSIDDL